MEPALQQEKQFLPLFKFFLSFLPSFLSSFPLSHLPVFPPDFCLLPSPQPPSHLVPRFLLCIALSAAGEDEQWKRQNGELSLSLPEGISHLHSIQLNCPGGSSVARDSVWPAVLTKSQEMWSAHGDQGKADTDFKPFPLLCSSEKRQAREWEGEKCYLLYCAESQEQTSATLFPQPSCSQPLTLPCPVLDEGRTGMTARDITS